MEQTSKYKLNKPGVDDPIAIAPLNENMDKLEAALQAETNALTAAIQAETSARTSAVASEASARAAAVQAEASARASAVTAETNARAAAVQAEASARAKADTAETNARTAADNALSARVKALEGKHIVMLTYTGNGAQDRVISLGFTPTGGVYLNAFNNYVSILTPADTPGLTPAIVSGGVLVPNSQPNFQYNASGKQYRMILFN